jgi:hypothetical protein
LQFQVHLLHTQVAVVALLILELMVVVVLVVVGQDQAFLELLTQAAVVVEMVARQQVVLADQV